MTGAPVTVQGYVSILMSIERVEPQLCLFMHMQVCIKRLLLLRQLINDHKWRYVNEKTNKLQDVRIY